MKAFDLTGRVAVVTGGHGGIGLGMARGLASAGAPGIVAGRNRDKSDRAVDELKGIRGQATAVHVDACAWAADHIQVNAVLPGWIDTDLTQASRREVAGLHERVKARIPDGDWGVPNDLSGIAAFLASSASDYITGVVIPVDGGYSVLG